MKHPLNGPNDAEKVPTKPWFRTGMFNIWKGLMEETVIERLVQPPSAQALAALRSSTEAAIPPTPRGWHPHRCPGDRFTRQNLGLKDPKTVIHQRKGQIPSR